jgi:hypothetical protein
MPNYLTHKKRIRAVIVASVAVILIAVAVVCALNAGRAYNAGQRERQALDAVDVYFAENLPTAEIVQKKYYYEQGEHVWVSYADESSAWTKIAVIERMGSHCTVTALNDVPESEDALPAPPYDPDSAFENVLEVSTEPGRYSPAMSNYPGIYIHAGGRAEGGAITRYECDSGSFATLEDGIITTLGTLVEREFGASPRVHWLPAPDTADGDKINISLELDGRTEDFVRLSVVKSDTLFYSLVRDES